MRQLSRVTGVRKALLGAAGLLLTLPLLAAAPPAAGAEKQELQELQRAVEEDRSRARDLARQADALAQEILDLQVKLVGAARKAREQEIALSNIEESLRDLEAQEARAAADLEARSAQLHRTLAALQRIALTPTEAVIVSPAPPIDIVRSAMLLRVAVPAIEERAEALRGELAKLESLRGRIAADREALAATTKLLHEERRKTAELIELKRSLQATTTAEQRAAGERAKKLARQAADLRELMARVEREAAEAERRQREAEEQRERERQQQARDAESPPEAEPEAFVEGQTPAGPELQIAELRAPARGRAFPDEEQSLILPAHGRVVTAFGELSAANAEGGAIAKGITIRTRVGAQVVAPYDGKIVYAGEFRSYGQILIIDHGQRYHTLLAGLDKIDAAVGQWVLAGEPIAIMGNPTGQSPELYLELRRTGQPINPLPWLAINGGKVRG